MKKIHIRDEINIIYYYIYKCENINKFEINFYIYKVFCIAEEESVNVTLIIEFLNKLCIYLKNLILTNKEYIYEMQKIKENLKKLKKYIKIYYVNEYVKYVKTLKNR